MLVFPSLSVSVPLRTVQYLPPCPAAIPPPLPLTPALSHGKIHPQASIPFPHVMPVPCKHAVVRIVSRHGDAEFVECLACGDIFDSVEYEDVAREEAFEAESAQTLQGQSSLED